MTPMQAIQSATLVAAELMGWEDRVGSLAPGRLADVVAVEDDAIEDVGRLTDASFVMKGGRVIKHDGRAIDGDGPGAGSND
jgi:imidazolonepropionase-like amidohydrolase